MFYFTYIFFLVDITEFCARPTLNTTMLVKKLFAVNVATKLNNKEYACTLYFRAERGFYF